ncbi:HEAT repeat domain-containing protein [Janibacter alittae]|uniref:HEAT repeat domain-containing protein n=1 Tax=Janibacter alittae TaxID=3115209 RepID=A0ABZ2MJV2_9MICO
MLATFVVLTVTITTARVARHRRTRSRDRDLVPVRGDVLAVVSGDDDGQASERLGGLRGQSAEIVDTLLIGYLSKVRGAPATDVVEILTAHGVVRRAEAGLTSWSGTRRAQSAWMLGVMRIPDSAQQIVPLLRDRDRGVSVTAARALGLLADEMAATPLLLALRPGHRGRGELPVWIVTEALVALGPAAADAIGDALDSDDASTRTAAATAIGSAQYLSQKARVRALAERESDPVALAAVARCLGDLGDTGDVATLAALTHTARPLAVRVAAVLALGEIGGPGAVGVLAALLDDPEERLADLAADALTRMGPRAVAELRASAETESPGAAAARYGLALRALRRPMVGGA